MYGKRLLPIGLGLLLLAVVGCNRPANFTTGDDFISPITPADITYAELAERYNKTIDPMTTLWSRADIDIEWIEDDDDGDRKYRRENGNGKFIMRRGDEWTDTAMTVEKLGKIYLWTGANRDNYYLFDRVDGNNKTLYVGEHGNTGRRKSFPLPVHPSVVPILLGLEPLPMDGLYESETTIDMYGDQYLLDSPMMGYRMLIDPQTFRPTRVDLTDRAGYSVLTAKLNGQIDVDTDEKRDRQPLLCEQAQVYVAGYESRFTLKFQSATTSTRRIRDQMFDLESLINALKPDRVIDLDR